jgi:hypothetical protein
MTSSPLPSPEPGPNARRAICDRCGARGWLNPGEARVCAECGGAYRPMALLEGLVDRLFAPPPQHVSEFYPRHLKLIELMWTAEGRGRETFEALALEKVSYTQFVTRATQVVIQGLSEGWIEVDIPAAPTNDDAAYGVRFKDPDRWADELTSAFSVNLPFSDQVRTDVEGDPDIV